MKRSPLAPESFPELPPVAGVQLAHHAAGLRYSGRPDLFGAVCDPGTVVAATFTSSQCPSAPVQWCRSVMSGGVSEARAVVVNAGNANAFTGSAGFDVSRAAAEQMADRWGLSPREVLLASTGVIGEFITPGSLNDPLARLADNLAAPTPEEWLAAATAITTTDTFPKGAGATVDLGDGTSVNLAGIAKGSGMIAPDMATMLAFVFTDAAVAPELLLAMTRHSVSASYNRITVDSDTSTSDSAMVFATGRSGAAPITDAADPRAIVLGEALDRLQLDLAHQIVSDGEGATKFVTVNVTGATSDDAAAKIARAIAESPLVKTALAASDANWGRIVMAVGKAGQPADRDRLAIWIGPIRCASSGTVDPDYDEELATEHLKGDRVEIGVDIGLGDGAATVWTCDLTHGYIEINAGYRS